MPLGVILYEGPSQLNNEQIIAIATFKSSNRKTGNMIQTWILRADMSPLEASKLGKDDAVCGTCPQRHSLNGACYVQIGQAPSGVYRAYKQGRYPQFLEATHAGLFAGCGLRCGAYGDPAAIPYDVWSRVLRLVDFHTGYTHAARHPRFDRRIADICMVSADTPAQALRYQAAGFSTFRVKLDAEPVAPKELVCTASVSKGVTCADCRLCRGIGSANIVIDIHGPLQSRWRTGSGTHG